MWRLLMLVQLSLMAISSWTMSPKQKAMSDVGMLAHFINARFLEMEEILRDLKTQMLTRCNASCCGSPSTSNPFDEDYEFIEEELRSSYHPQNHFCYSIVREANEDFKGKIKRLASCFPNVAITAEEFNIKLEYLNKFSVYSGHYINDAFYSCMKLLSKRPGWEYMILHLNYDVMIKSPYEIVEIYKTLDGANDVEVSSSPDNRWNHSLKWDARSLKLFVNESLASPQQLDATLQFAHGSTQVSLSRAAVEWLVNTVNLTTLLDQINSMPFGVEGLDELLFSSLQSSDGLDMPGRFTSECLKKGKRTDLITRLDRFDYFNGEKCRSRSKHSSMCIFGLEDLQELSESPRLLAYKLFPDFDYGVVDCVHELIFNRTFLGQVDRPLNLGYYRNMVNVKFHKNRKHPNASYTLECE